MDEKYHAQLQLRRRLWNTGLLAATLASPLSLMAASTDTFESDCAPLTEKAQPHSPQPASEPARRVENKETPFNHPLMQAASQGISLEDLENGRVGYEVYSYSDRCGNQLTGQRAVKAHTDLEPALALQNERRQKQPRPSGVRFNPALLKKAAAGRYKALSKNTEHDTEETTAIIRFQRPQLENMELALDKAILQGKIKTRRDYQRYQQKLQTRHQRKLERFMRKKIDGLVKAGVTVRSHSAHTASAEVSLNNTQLDMLANAALVRNTGKDGRIQLATSAAPFLAVEAMHSIEPLQATKSTALDGDTFNLGTQVDQMISRNYQGWDNGNRLNAAVIEVENGAGDADHPGFSAWSGGSSRVRQQYDCSSGSCSTRSYIPAVQSGFPHALAVTGVMIGDITEGQDSGYSGSQDRRARSGAAQESTVDLLYAPGYTGRNALNYVAANASRYRLVNNSWGMTTSDCSGQINYDVAANAAYEAGVAVIATAGNKGHSGSGCTMAPPGTAIGSFTVGGHGNQGDISYGGTAVTRSGAIYSSSSRGGDDSGRTSVDITAPACHGKLYSETGDYNYWGCGTSFAAPQVSGAALNFINWWQGSGFSTDIQKPGVLYSNLLLMGDGQQESSNSYNQYKEAGFDNLWGAGRLKARLWDDAGMDGPWAWGSGYQCVGQGQSIYIDTWNSSAVSSDVDVMKAVIWWYDRRHENGQQIDNIDLSVQRLSSNGSWYTRRSSTNLTDNKERVVLHDFSGSYSARHRLKISGYRVTADAEGCGTNKMKVYYAYYYEDSDRDDSDGPSWNSSSQIGVEPQAQD